MMSRDMPTIGRRTLIVFGGYAAAFVAVAVVNLLDVPPLVLFAFAVIALAFGAVAVSEATERLAHRMSPAATGVVQSTHAIVSDGEANAFAGAMLLGVYAIIGAAVWFGPAIGT